MWLSILFLSFSFSLFIIHIQLTHGLISNIFTPLNAAEGKIIFRDDDLLILLYLKCYLGHLCTDLLSVIVRGIVIIFMALIWRSRGRSHEVSAFVAPEIAAVALAVGLGHYCFDPASAVVAVVVQVFPFQGHMRVGVDTRNHLRGQHWRLVHRRVVLEQRQALPPVG